ncbi:MAG TPA: hypothetical protein VGM68_12255 [Rhizomicrobium sp.]|jgi:hypothetical protein
MLVSKSGPGRREKSLPSTVEMMRMASDFAEEHGADACDFAYRAVVSLEAEGEGERAYLWFLLLVMLGDIASNQINPDRPLTIH